MSATATGPHRRALLAGVTARPVWELRGFARLASSDDIRLRGSFTITGSATTMEPAAWLLTRVTVS